MLTLIVVADTFSQYQAFMRRYFRSAHSKQEMLMACLHIMPRDPNADMQLAGAKGGLYFCVSRPDDKLVRLLAARRINEAQMMES